MSRHTQGYWVRGNTPHTRNQIFGEDRCDGSAQVVAEVYGYTQEEMEANMRIILDALPKHRASS